MDEKHAAGVAEADPAADEAHAVAAAEAAVARLKAQYKGWLLNDIAKMKGAYAAATGDATNRAAHLQALYAVSHDVKGQGGSFGYDLVTDIGQSLCTLLKRDEAGSKAGLVAVATHIAALEAVAEAGLEGDGGQAGAKLLARLEAAVGSLPG